MSSIPSLYHQIETKLAHLYGTDQASALLTDIIKLVETMPAGTQPALSLPDTLKFRTFAYLTPPAPSPILGEGEKNAS